MKFLSDLEISNKRVLIRADLNVPLKDDGTISDDDRIKQFVPTLKAVIEKEGKAIVMSHLGRPEGNSKSKYSLKPIAERLNELLGKPVELAPDCVGPQVEALAEKLQAGEVLLLENLRFHEAEKNNDPEFSALLARLGDVYINDAFATAHRAHASVVGVTRHFKDRAAGLLLQREIEYYEKSLVKPKHPLCVILGGAKVSTKLKALINLSDKADKIIIGGAMANTFLAAQGYQMGKSLVERDLFPTVIQLLAKLARKDCKVYLPVDFMAGPSLQAKGTARAVTAQEMPADLMALDIGPGTRKLYAEAIVNAETVIWNGPMGAFENEEYADGTTDLIEAIGQAHGLTVVGGGDTNAAIHKMELEHKFDYISTGGGAFLTLLEGERSRQLQLWNENCAKNV